MWKKWVQQIVGEITISHSRNHPSETRNDPSVCKNAQAHEKNFDTKKMNSVSLGIVALFLEVRTLRAESHTTEFERKRIGLCLLVADFPLSNRFAVFFCCSSVFGDCPTRQPLRCWSLVFPSLSRSLHRLVMQ